MYAVDEIEKRQFQPSPDKPSTSESPILRTHTELSPYPPHTDCVVRLKFCMRADFGTFAAENKRNCPNNPAHRTDCAPSGLFRPDYIPGRQPLHFSLSPKSRFTASCVRLGSCPSCRKLLPWIMLQGGMPAHLNSVATLLQDRFTPRPPAPRPSKPVSRPPSARHSLLLAKCILRPKFQQHSSKPTRESQS